MRWLYLMVLLFVNLISYAPTHLGTDVEMKTLKELEIEKLKLEYEARFEITLYKDKISKSFGVKLKQVARKLDIPTDWFILVMWHESRLNSKAINPVTKATGLIQFLPVTARGLKTSTYAIYRMSPERQLDYVYKFYKPAKGKFAHVTDLYLYTFFPITILKSWPDSKVLRSRGVSAEKIAKQNKGFDLNKDGVLTVGEIRTKILKYYDANLNK